MSTSRNWNKNHQSWEFQIHIFLLHECKQCGNPSRNDLQPYFTITWMQAIGTRVFLFNFVTPKNWGIIFSKKLAELVKFISKINSPKLSNFGSKQKKKPKKTILPKKKKNIDWDISIHFFLFG